MLSRLLRAIWRLGFKTSTRLYLGDQLDDVVGSSGGTCTGAGADCHLLSMAQLTTGKFKLLIPRGGLLAGAVIEAVEFLDLGPITTSQGLVDVLLRDSSVLQMVDPRRHLRRVRSRRGEPA